MLVDVTLDRVRAEGDRFLVLREINQIFTLSLLSDLYKNNNIIIV